MPSMLRRQSVRITRTAPFLSGDIMGVSVRERLSSGKVGGRCELCDAKFSGLDRTLSEDGEEPTGFLDARARARRAETITGTAGSS